MKRIIYSGLIIGLYVIPQLVTAESNTIEFRSLQDISLSTPDPRYGSWGALDLCVFSYPGAYQITVRDEQLDGKFQLTAGTYDLPCQLYFNDRPGLSGRQPLREGVVLSGLNSRNHSTNCQDANANLSIEITPTTVLSSPAGHYSARFFLQISPE